MAVVGNLVVNLKANSAQFDRGMKAAGARLKTFSKNAFTVRNAMLAMAGAAGMAYAAKKVFDLGAAVEETGSKFRTVFGESSKSVQAFIDDFGVMAGLSNRAAQDIVATTGAIAQGMGFAQAESAKFSQEVVKLAGDLASFNNLETADTAATIQAALAGERESLKRLGIVVMEADVQQRALLNTGKETAKALTQQEKATATLQLITQRAGKAVGDLARTQDSAANRAKQVRARFQNIAETVSTSVLPALENILPVLDQIATKAEKAAQGVAGFVDAFSDLLGLSSSELTATLNSISNLPDDMDVLRHRFVGVNREVARLQAIVTQMEASPPLFDPHEGVMPSEKIARAREELSRAIAVMNELGRRMAALSSGGGEGGGGAISRMAYDLGHASENALAGSASLGVMQMEAVKLTAKLKPIPIEFDRMAVFAVDFANTFSDAVVDAVDNGIASFRRFADAVIAQLIRIAVKMAVLRLFDLFATGGQASALAAATGGQSGGFFGPVFGRASGGPVAPGRPYMVGERGPELFVPKGSGDIVPGGGDSVFHFTFVTPDGRDVGNFTYRQKRDEALDRNIMLPVPLMAM